MDRVDRPSNTGCLYDGFPNEEKRGPVPSKFGAPWHAHSAKADATSTATNSICATPPPRKPPPWKPAPPMADCHQTPPPPPDPPSPPPPWPAAHPALVRAIDVMPTKLSSFNFFILQDRDSSVFAASARQWGFVIPLQSEICAVVGPRAGLRLLAPAIHSM